MELMSVLVAEPAVSDDHGEDARLKFELVTELALLIVNVWKILWLRLL